MPKIADADIYRAVKRGIREVPAAGADRIFLEPDQFRGATARARHATIGPEAFGTAQRAPMRHPRGEEQLRTCMAQSPRQRTGPVDVTEEMHACPAAPKRPSQRFRPTS